MMVIPARFSSLLLLTIPLLLLISNGCDSPTKLEPTNPADPLSSSFEVAAPTDLVNAIGIGNQSGEPFIRLLWKVAGKGEQGLDQFVNGFIIEKSVETDQNFEVLDTLRLDQFNKRGDFDYIDSNIKQLNLFYRVRSFVSGKDSLKVSQAVETSHKQNLSNVDVRLLSESSIEINWDDEGIYVEAQVQINRVSIFQNSMDTTITELGAFDVAKGMHVDNYQLQLGEQVFYRIQLINGSSKGSRLGTKTIEKTFDKPRVSRVESLGDQAFKVILEELDDQITDITIQKSLQSIDSTRAPAPVSTHFFRPGQEIIMDNLNPADGYFIRIKVSNEVADSPYSRWTLIAPSTEIQKDYEVFHSDRTIQSQDLAIDRDNRYFATSLFERIAVFRVHDGKKLFDFPVQQSLPNFEFTTNRSNRDQVYLATSFIHSDNKAGIVLWDVTNNAPVDTIRSSLGGSLDFGVSRDGDQKLIILDRPPSGSDNNEAQLKEYFPFTQQINSIKTLQPENPEVDAADFELLGNRFNDFIIITIPKEPFDNETVNAWTFARSSSSIIEKFMIDALNFNPIYIENDRFSFRREVRSFTIISNSFVEVTAGLSRASFSGLSATENASRRLIYTLLNRETDGYGQLNAYGIKAMLNNRFANYTRTQLPDNLFAIESSLDQPFIIGKNRFKIVKYTTELKWIKRLEF